MQLARFKVCHLTLLTPNNFYLFSILSTSKMKSKVNAVDATNRERFSVMIGALVYVSTIIFLSTKMGGRITCAANKNGKLVCRSFDSSPDKFDTNEVNKTTDNVDGVSFIHRFVAFNSSDKLEWMPLSRQGWYVQFEHFGLPHMPMQNLEQATKAVLKSRADKSNFYNYQSQCQNRAANSNCKKLRKMIDETPVTVYDSWTSPTYTKSVWGIQCILYEKTQEKPYRTCTYSFFHSYLTKDVAQLPPPQLIQPLLIGGRRVGTSI